MITRLDIEERVREWGLREDVVEKDYVIGWVLWGIGADEALSTSWAFKGGTSLKKFDWLEGRLVREELASAPQQGEETDDSWTPPATVWTWGEGVPVESLRFAAANHLCVDLGYGNSVRRIEPYAFRLTKAGKVLLCAVTIQTRESRTYRLDRIQSIKVTNQPFRPAFRVEITGRGHLSVPQLARTTPARPFRAVSTFRGPKVVYVVKCTSCGKEFKRSKADFTLRPHKGRGGWQCPSHTGYLVRTSYE